MLGEAFEQVLKSACAGERLALEALYRDIHPAVSAYLRHRLPTADAEDVGSEVFLAVARGLSAFEGSERAFRSWVFTIAHHRAADDRRRAARRRTDPYPTDAIIARAPAGDAEEDALASLGTASALVEIAKLPAAQAEVLLLRIVADLSVRDVARILDKAPEAVRALQHRALRRLVRAHANEAAGAR